MSLQTSQSIARLVGPVFAVVGSGILTSQAAYREMASQFVAGYPFIYFSGILLLTAGLAILNAHPGWTHDWRSAITLLGWVLSCIGAFRIIAPPFVALIGGSLFARTGFFIGIGFLFLGFGAFITFKGYAENAATETYP
jgi:hypothetical protein